MLYFDKLSVPKSQQLAHRRLATNPNLPSPINSSAFKDLPSSKILTSPNLLSPKATKFSRPRFQSLAFATSPSNLLRDDPSFAMFMRPQTTKNSTKIRNSKFFRPSSASVNIISISDTNKLDLKNPQLFSTLETSKEEKLEESKPTSPTSPKLRVSIFETYKDPNQIGMKDSSENAKKERKFKILMSRKREKKKLINNFEKFFVKCDMETVMQYDETKTLEEEFKKFGREYGKMQYMANKNVERYNLHSSDNQFNQMRAQISFKKKLIDHLLEKVSDKQDLLSMYNKHVSMEDNIDKSKLIINE